MRLNWFSPLPPARTDIANYTVRVLPALLERGVEVKVWSSHPDYDPAALPGGVQHAPAVDPRLPWPEVNFREHTIFQVGNDYRFHGTLLRHLEQHGGIVILHDTNLHEAQRMRFLEEENGTAAYLARLGRAGGDAGMRDGRNHLRGAFSIEKMIERYPLTESVLVGAHGVIVHHPAAVEFVRPLTSAPIACLPLPFSPMEEWPLPRARTIDPERPLRLVMFGFLHGSNRRLGSVLKALACCHQRQRFVLDLFGELPADDLSRRLEELGLQKQVRFHGFVGDERMRTLLADADLAVNLRNPTRGEASGSLLRIWSHGLPCVVSDNGIFSTLPADTVVRIPTDEGEILALADVFDRFAEDPAAFSAIGANGRAHLERTHTPRAYVDGLLEFLPLVEAYRGRAYLEHYLPKLAHEVIAELPAPVAQDYWADRIAAIFAEGFNGPGPGA